MKNEMVIDKKKFAIGEQWQHMGTKDTAYILSIDVYNINSPFNGQTRIIFQLDTLRLALPLDEFLQLYRYIPHMKGAYH